MTTRSCSVLGCPKPYYAAGFCSRHYQQHRLHGSVPEVDVSQRQCGHCGSSLGHKTDDRTQYCSRECKELARTQRGSLARQQAKVGRTCAHCKEPLEASRGGKAKFCSEQCTTEFHNTRRALETRIVKESTRKPCKGCLGPLPVGRRGNTMYCSDDCKSTARRHQAYGLTKVQLAVLLEQHECCAICRTDDWSGKGPQGPQVDHCHVTKRVRGVLCNNCNQGLGRFKDRVDLLEAAVAYLKR